MNPNSSSYYPANEISSTIEPYYVKGDVFQRDQRYYDQIISGTRRNRSPNRSGLPIDSNTLNSNIRANQGVNPNTTLSGPIITNSGSYIPPPATLGPQSPSINQIIVNPPPQQLPPQQIAPIIDQDELRRLRQQNIALTSQLQKLTYGGEFGTGDTVIKKGHYTASKAENATIRDQQLKIRSMQETLRLNNEKLIKYQRASSQLQARMQSIQSLDKQIYTHLKGASSRDKQLLDRAANALLRGEPKENVLRILEQIIVT